MTRARSTPLPLRWAVLVAALLAVAAGGLNGSGRWGQSPGEFAADSDRLLRVAAYAFTIWGPIYLGLLAYAVRGVLARSTSELEARLVTPALAALAGIGLWIVAAGLDAEVWTIVLIVGALTALLWPLLAHADLVRALPAWSMERALVLWPLGALAGWLTIAAPVNLLTVAVGNGDLPPGPPVAWALAAVAAVTVGGLIVTARVRTLAYPLPIAWGLAAVAVAEHARKASVLSNAAAAAAIIVAAGGAWLALRGARR